MKLMRVLGFSCVGAFISTALFALVFDSLSRRLDYGAPGMMSIYLVIVLPLGFILGGLAGLLFNQQKKMEVYNETQGQLHYWQEQLEDFFPFQGMVGNEIESGAFETGEEVTAVGLVWVDDENGVMVECHGSGKQSDLPLLNLVVPETSEVFTHLMAYKRERGHFR